MTPTESVWDMYLKFMIIIFGENMPPILATFTFFIFFIFIFSVVIWILKVIIGGVCGLGGN